MQNLQGMKETFLALVPGLSPDSIQRIGEAKSRQELLKVFDSVLDHGSCVTRLEPKKDFRRMSSYHKRQSLEWIPADCRLTLILSSAAR
jgi:hypothetical protein